MPKWAHPKSWQTLVLLLHDVIALYFITELVYWYKYGYWLKGFSWQLALVIFTTIICLYVANVYRLDRSITTTQLILRTFIGVTISGILLATAIYVTKTIDLIAIFWRGNLITGLFLFALWASLIRSILRVVYRKLVAEKKWVVFGSKENCLNLEKDHQGFPDSGILIKIICEVADYNQFSISQEGAKLIISHNDIDLLKERIDGLILANTRDLPDKLIKSLMQIRLSGIPVLRLPNYYEQYLLRVPVMHLKDGWFVMSDGFGLVHHDIALKIKRLIDVLISFFGLIILSPIMAITAILIKSTSKGSVFYNQQRIGHRGNVFQLHKFRTMIDNAEEKGIQWALVNDPRITPIGKILRRTRIDELPQLWNVLLGNMSFIGPRPERQNFIEQLEKQIPYYDLRHLVKPGITGWAQVMYPYGASVEDARKKLEFDLFYVKNYSIAMDISIVFRTMRVVFAQSGR